jgi:hypothetical protein
VDCKSIPFKVVGSSPTLFTPIFYMLVFSYFVFDAYFLFLNLCLVLLLSIFITLNFKEQFLFLYCLPFLNQIGSTNLFVTNFSAIFYLYPYLLLISVGLLVFTSSFVGFCFLVVPALSNALLRRFFVRFLVVLSFFIGYTFIFFSQCVPIAIWSLTIFVPSFYRVISVSFDFTLDAWISGLLVLFCIALFVFLVVTCLLSLIFLIKHEYAFVFRVVTILLLFLCLVLFVPQEPALHFILIFVCLFCFELLLFFRAILSSYSGRVA